MNIQNNRLVSNATYRQTTKRLGLALVLFSVLFFALELVTDACSNALPENITREAELLVTGLAEGVCYLISFLVPVWLILHLTPRGERYPLPFEVHWPRRACLIIPAGLAVIHTAAVANDFLIRCFGWTTAGATVPYWVDGMPIYEVILLFLTSALIPAFCEELLFRGVVLSVLRPYGRTVAILGSAVLFSFMHQRADQLLYTAVAGAVLAYITLESHSLWGAMLLHLLNNALSALKVVLYGTLVSGTAKVCYAAVEIVVIGVGLCCLAAFVAKASDRRTVYASEGRAPTRPVKDFLTWPMLIFLDISVVQMVLLVILDVTR